jgi:hypothetical protein
MREVLLSNAQIALIVEGLEILRLHENGNPNDYERAIKTSNCQRLQERLERKLVHFGSGNIGEYADKL